MGRDSWRFRQMDEAREKRKRMNPVWRGVGCFMMIMLSLAGYLFSTWFLTENALNQWIYLPPEVIHPTFLPAWVPPYAFASFVVALIFLILSYGVVSLVYAVAFPLQPGETDAPPLRRTGPRRR
jgi:hypothetical protein